MGNLPRVDVSTSAMIGATAALLMALINYFLLANPAGLAAVPALCVVVVVGLVAYLFPAYKEPAGAVAGALVVLVEGYLSSRTGNPVDMGSISAAVTLLVQGLFLFVLPRLRVIARPHDAEGQAAPYQLRRDVK